VSRRTCARRLGAALLALGLAVALPAAGGGGSVLARSGGCGLAAQPTIEGGGSLAGTLVVRPRCASPGDRVAIAVKNVGESAMVHGVCARIQRPSDLGWRDTAFTRNQVCIEIAAITRPGETTRIQSVELPQRLGPGRFRALLVVNEKGTSYPRTLGLQAIFRVVLP
jgi:hypothetical protein